MLRQMCLLKFGDLSQSAPVSFGLQVVLNLLFSEKLFEIFLFSWNFDAKFKIGKYTTTSVIQPLSTLIFYPVSSRAKTPKSV